MRRLVERDATALNNTDFKPDNNHDLLHKIENRSAIWKRASFEVLTSPKKGQTLAEEFVGKRKGLRQNLEYLIWIVW